MLRRTTAIAKTNSPNNQQEANKPASNSQLLRRGSSLAILQRTQLRAERRPGEDRVPCEAWPNKQTEIEHLPVAQRKRPPIGSYHRVRTQRIKKAGQQSILGREPFTCELPHGNPRQHESQKHIRSGNNLPRQNQPYYCASKPRERRIENESRVAKAVVRALCPPGEQVALVELVLGLHPQRHVKRKVVPLWVAEH